MNSDDKTRSHSHDDLDRHDDRLNELIADYLQQLDQGTARPRDDFIADHSEFADELAGFFADVDHFAAGATSESPPASTSDDGDEPFPHVRYFGEYELTREIARGGMGVVYEARQKTLKRTVAVKMILSGMLASDEDVQRFHTEAQAAAGLQHSGIVSIHEVGVCQGQHYFSMDYVEGSSLAELIGESTLPADQAARYLKLVAEAVQFAHTEGTLHRDLKPSNILIDAATDEPRITDFGLARQLHEDSGLTATGAQLGTPSYMSPEQAAGHSNRVGPASDIYSLGAVLYELLTGHPPFRGSSVMQTLSMVMERAPVPPRQINPNIPRDIETVCLKCLQKDPADRFPSASDLAADLQRFLDGDPVQARRLGRVARTGRWLWKRRISTATLTALVAVVTGVTLQRQWQAAYEASMLGKVTFVTDGAPLVTTIMNGDGDVVIPRFTAPTAEPVALTEDDYVLEASTPGRMSQQFRMLIDRGVTQPRRLELENPDRRAPIVLGQAVFQIRRHGRSGLIVSSAHGLSRVDTITGHVTWEDDLSRDKSVQKALASRRDVGRLPRISVQAESAIDVDADGVDDILTCGPGASGAEVRSGADGRVLWTITPLPETQVEAERSTSTVQPPSVFVERDVQSSWILLTRSRPETNLKAGTAPAERRVECVDGSSGQTLWKYSVAADQYKGPLEWRSEKTTASGFTKSRKFSGGPGKQLPAFLMSVGDRLSAIVPTGRSLVRLDADTGTNVIKLATWNWPLEAVAAHDLNGDGQKEILTAHRATPKSFHIEAIDAAEGHVLWTHSVSEVALNAAGTGTWLVVPDATSNRVVVAIASSSNLISGGHREHRLSFVNGDTGVERWKRTWKVPRDGFEGLTTRVFAAPDIDGDGQDDVLVSWSGELSGGHEARVSIHACSTADGSELWEWSDVMVSTPRTPYIRKIDQWAPGADGLPQLVITCAKSQVDLHGNPLLTTHVLSSRSGRRTNSLPDVGPTVIVDSNADGLDDLQWVDTPNHGQPFSESTLQTTVGSSPVVWRRIGDWKPVADFDGDGVTDLLSQDRSHSPAAAVSGKTGELLWRADQPIQRRRLIPLPGGDLDGDGSDDLLEFVESGFDRHSLTLVAVSGNSRRRIWKQTEAWELDVDPLIDVTQCLDVNLDGHVDVIFARRLNHSTPHVEINAIDGRTGEMIWQETESREDHDRYWIQMRTAKDTLLLASRLKETFGVTGRRLSDGKTLWNCKVERTGGRRPENEQSPLPFGDLDGDGRMELVSMTRPLSAVTLSTGEPLWTWQFPQLPGILSDSPARLVGAGAAIRLSTNGRLHFAFHLADRLVVVDDSGQTLRELTFRNRGFRHWHRNPTRLAALDTNNDGRDELVMTAQTVDESSDTVEQQHVVLVVDPMREEPVLWEWPLPAGFGDIMATRVLSTRQSEVVLCSGRSVYCLDGETGKIRWYCEGPRWWNDTLEGRPQHQTYFERRPVLLNAAGAESTHVLFERNELNPNVIQYAVECRTPIFSTARQVQLSRVR